jgi:hypothetical protein
MKLNPREYLHQHFGEKDRRWIESLSDDRCWELLEIVDPAKTWIAYRPGTVQGTTIKIKRPQRYEDLHPLPGDKQLQIDHNGKISGFMEDLNPLPDIPGEYPNWR